MTSPLPLPIPASPGLGAWLQGLGISLAFTLYRVNRLLCIGTAEPADGSSDPGQLASALQLKRQERRFDRPMGLVVVGESFWMPARYQIWRHDNLLGPSQLHVGGDLPPGVPQPRPLGLQGEPIDCLVKIADQSELLHLRPLAPSGKPHPKPSVRPFGLSEPSAAEIRASQTAAAITDVAAPGAYGTTNAPAPAETPIRYLRLFQLTPADLAPYAELTFPSLVPGTSALAPIQVELAAGLKVALAIPERRVDDSAQQLSLFDLAVLHHHAPGCGLLVHRTAAASVRYSSLDVVPAHRGKGRALALLSEGLRRQHAAAIPSADAAIDRHNTASVCLLKRHQAARRSRFGHFRHCQSPTLASPPPPPPSFPNPPNPPPPQPSLDP